MFRISRVSPFFPFFGGGANLLPARVLRKTLGAGGNVQRDLAHFFVDKAVSRENERSAKVIRLALEIADFAARFFDEQNARGDVPLVEAKFPEAVEAARSDAGKIKRRGAIAADAMRTLREFAIILKIRAQLAIAHRKPGAKQACGKSCGFRDGDFLAVETSAFASRRGVQLVVVRIEHHSGQ